MSPKRVVAILLQAAAELDGDWRLRLVGGGSALAETRALAASLGIGDRLSVVGQLPSADLPAEYHKLDALVLPSLTRRNWKEQFGRVLVEAMASGLPAIGSDSGAIPSVLGAAGLVVPEGDAAALARALRALRDGPARRAELIKKGAGALPGAFHARTRGGGDGRCLSPNVVIITSNMLLLLEY